MVHWYSTGDDNVSFLKGTLAPPSEYGWTCASFGPLESTADTANGSVQSFLHSLWQKVPILLMGAPIHQNCPFPCGITWTFHVIHDAFGQNESTTQTAPRSVQPSLHRWPRSVSIHCNGSPVFPQNCPFPCWHLDLIGSLGPPESGTQMATLSFQPFMQGWQIDRATERPTDHATLYNAA